MEVIHFPRGLIGLESLRNFSINIEENEFFFLHSMESPAFRFPVIALPGIIEEADLIQACSELEIKKQNLICLYIITFRLTDPGSTVNQKAPILIDAQKKTGWQYVFNGYTLRLPINDIINKAKAVII